MMAAGIALAACSGGDDGLSEEEEATLQEQLDQAVADAAAEKAAKETAEKAKEAAEAAAKEAAAQAAAAAAAAKAAAEAVAEAIADRQEAEAKQEEAEEAQAEAEAAEAEAERLRLAAAAATAATAEEQRRRQAEEAREQAEMERDKAVQQATRADSRLVRDGLLTGITSGGSDGTVMVTPRYNASAMVTTANPSVSFLNPTTGSLSGWYQTAFVKSEQAESNRLEVYSNVEATKSIPFKDSQYNEDNEIVNTEGEIIMRLGITGARDDVAGSGFPRSSGPPRSYDLRSRGMIASEFTTLNSQLLSDHDGNSDQVIDSSERDQAFRDALEAAGITQSQYSSYVSDRGFRDTAHYPGQWNAEVSGNLGGASGRYVCSSGMSDTVCTVQNRGSDLNFVGPWTFRPSSATTGVRVEDSVYMYFGWWSRQKFNPEDNEQAWTFETFHGPTTDRVTGAQIAEVAGSATYRGPAAGYYAIYEPNSAGSEHGPFTATAELEANFDTNMVQGTIDQFSGHSDWSVALERGGITGGNTGQSTDGVTWTIGGTAGASDESWEASFYSNIVDNNPKTSAADELRTGVMPSGIAGTFSATYDNIGRLKGAFGAHCVDVVCRP